MLKGLLTFILFMFFVVWMVAPANPTERMERACAPVNWIGNVTVSITAAVSAKNTAKVQSLFDSGNYHCQYILWRLFYEKDWVEYQKTLKHQPSKEPEAE